jgi:hypothetical protein
MHLQTQSNKLFKNIASNYRLDKEHNRSINKYMTRDMLESERMIIQIFLFLPQSWNK